MFGLEARFGFFRQFSTGKLFGYHMVFNQVNVVFVVMHVNMQMWVTKAEYNENGPGIIHRKCF